MSPTKQSDQNRALRELVDSGKLVFFRWRKAAYKGRYPVYNIALITREELQKRMGSEKTSYPEGRALTTSGAATYIGAMTTIQHIWIDYFSIEE